MHTRRRPRHKSTDCEHKEIGAIDSNTVSGFDRSAVSCRRVAATTNQPAFGTAGKQYRTASECHARSDRRSHRCLPDGLPSGDSTAGFGHFETFSFGGRNLKHPSTTALCGKSRFSCRGRLQIIGHLDGESMPPIAVRPVALSAMPISGMTRRQISRPGRLQRALRPSHSDRSWSAAD